MCGGYFDTDPVLKVDRQRLDGRGRFRAAVHAVITIIRMKFLVQRWRTGKRAGGRGGSGSKPWSSAFSASSIGQPSPVNPRQYTPVRTRPDTLGLHTPGPLNSPRGVRRTSSLREHQSRYGPSPSSLRELSQGRSMESPSSLSSCSSIFQPPVITGRTPPTRDTGRRAGRGSEPGIAGLEVDQQARRSLGHQFNGDSMSAPVHPDIQADLRDYMEKFQHLEEKLGVKF